MDQLFGVSELEKLRTLDYKTDSHTFSKGVIAAYYNGMEYPLSVKQDYIEVKRKKDSVYFFLKDIWLTLHKNKDIIHEKATAYSLVKTELTKVKTKEVIYNLDQIFTNPNKQVRRALNLKNRKDIGIRGILTQDKEVLDNLYNEWYLAKLADPKVFRIAFTPKRYMRSFKLKELGFNIFDVAYFVNGELYGAICYEVQGDIAFELAFISKYWNKDLKVINDLNECILIDSFYQLYQQGVKRINVGPTAGIKGLKVFKNKLPHDYVEIYSN